MKKTLKFLFVYLFLLPSTKVAAAAVTQYAEQRQIYIDSILNENVQMVAKHFNETGELLLQGNASILGVANIERYFASLFEQFEITAYNRDMTEILEMGGKTAEIGSYSLSMRNSKGLVRSMEGSYLSIWDMAENSEPKIALELWNFDHQINFSHELQFDDVPSTITAFEAHLPINSPASMELAAYATLIKDSVLMRDGAVLGQFYTQDGVILRNSNPPVVGIKDINHYWKQHASEIASMEGLQQRTTKLEEIGKYIIEHAAHIAIWRSGTYSGVNTGKHIRIWERQGDGRIKTRILASAYDK